MKKIVPLLIFLLVLTGSVSAVDHKCKKINTIGKNHITCIDDAEISVRRNTIYITSRDWDEGVVEITEEYELYVDDEFIKLTEYQQELTESYYEMVMQILDDARHIGLKGAKMGVSGAKIGLMAVVGVVKLLSPDYDEEDLERELEEEAEKLEAEAEVLEEEAELIEEIAAELEEVHYELRNEIDSLRKLDWF